VSRAAALALVLAGCATLDDQLIDKRTVMVALVDSGDPRIAHRPVVVAKVGGKDAKFVVDTGAPYHALNQAFAVSMGIPGDGAEGTLDLWGETPTVERFRVADFRKAGVPDVAELAGVLSPFELAGPGRATVIDLPRERVLTADFDKAVAAYAPKRRALVGPADLCTSVVDGVVRRRPLARGSVGGQAGVLLVDTGGQSMLWRGGVLFPRDPIQDDAGTLWSRSKDARFGDVGFPGHRWLLRDATWNEGCRPDGLLGAEHLAKCVIVVDARRFFVTCE
jgi:hypothetical protein